MALGFTGLTALSIPGGGFLLFLLALFIDGLLLIWKLQRQEEPKM